MENVGSGKSFSGLRRLKMGEHIAVLEVTQLAVGHKQVFEAIQIDIQKDRRPGPFGSFDTSIESRFRERAIPATQLQRIAIDLRPAVNETDGPPKGTGF